MTKHLVWFRADLRTIDNTALFMACQSPDANVLAVYFISPAQWQQHYVAGCKVDFELKTLQQLSTALNALNIPLLVIQTPNFNSQVDVLIALMQQHHINHLFYNKQYEINEAKRDNTLKARLLNSHITTHEFDDQCLVAPTQILTGEGRFYSVFTPFKKNWLQKITQQGYKINPAPSPRTQHNTIAPSPIPVAIDGFNSHISPAIAKEYWLAGEDAALARLQYFCEHHLRSYKEARDFPMLDSTSKLSPYLAVGAISSRQCYQAAVNEQLAHGTNDSIEQWISELAWREFYKHIMVGFPRVCKNQPFKTETNALVWRHDEADFKRWCEGNTGFPLVDAAMRQLNTIGWMHNRLRMVVSMFLTKDLFIDWRWGERYFMQRLIDGDLAANNGGWQWSASTGNDAAPYFRVFNPKLQSERFDANGDFIRQYVPELAHLDAKSIHEPHGKQQQLFLDYPLPMVNHRLASQAAIEAFKQLKHN